MQLARLIWRGARRFATENGGAALDGESPRLAAPGGRQMMNRNLSRLSASLHSFFLCSFLRGLCGESEERSRRVRPEDLEIFRDSVAHYLDVNDGVGLDSMRQWLPFWRN